MAFADPQTITINAVPYTLNRVVTGKNLAEYADSSGLVRLSAVHSYGKRTRRVIRVDHSKVTSDPFIPAQNVKVSMSNYIVFDVPAVGYTLTEAQQVWTGFKTLVTASSDALIVKLLGGES